MRPTQKYFNKAVTPTATHICTLIFTIGFEKCERNLAAAVDVYFRNVLKGHSMPIITLIGQSPYSYSL